MSDRLLAGCGKTRLLRNALRSTPAPCREGNYPQDAQKGRPHSPSFVPGRIPMEVRIGIRTGHSRASRYSSGRRTKPLSRIIHERFCCNRGFAAATGLSAGGLAARSVDILFKDASLPHGSTRPSRFATPPFRDEPSCIMWARASYFLRAHFVIIPPCVDRADSTHSVLS